jgi:hypothetical protein
MSVSPSTRVTLPGYRSAQEGAVHVLISAIAMAVCRHAVFAGMIVPEKNQQPQGSAPFGRQFTCRNRSWTGEQGLQD